MSMNRFSGRLSGLAAIGLFAASALAQPGDRSQVDIKARRSSICLMVDTRPHPTFDGNGIAYCGPDFRPRIFPGHTTGAEQQWKCLPKGE